MASSQIEIVNYALAELGADLITSMSDPVKAASLATAMWPICTEAVMRAYPWNCLIDRADLTPDAQAPLGDDWSTSFALPPLCLRVLRTDITDDEYVVEGRKLLANTNTVKIKYLKKVTDVTLWDSLFVHAVTARMAQALAYPLTQSQSLKDTMGEAYKTRVREARSIDAQEGKLDTLQADEWLESRV
jgi:hypothetical protein